MKRVTLELGGKSACVVFADADLEKVGRMAPYAVFENCGQDCCARSRLLVEESVAGRGGRALLPRPRRDLRVGMPEDPDTEIGPLISAGQRDTVEGYIAVGVDEGARLVTGGERPGGALEAGFFLRPTVLDGATNDMTVAREEIFGPVVSVISSATRPTPSGWPTTRRMASPGSLWTRDGARQLRVARALRTGVLGVNTNSSACSCRRRSAATSSRASARSWACTRSRTTPSSRACSSRPSRAWGLPWNVFARRLV